MNYVYVVKGEDHAQTCCMSIASVRSHNPAADVFVYVDVFYDCLDNAGAFQVSMPDAFEHPFMVSTLLCKNDWVTGADAMTCFLDNDTIMVGSPELKGDFDIAVTWRPRNDPTASNVAGEMPYNTGVQFVNPTTSAVHAFHWLVQRVMLMSNSSKKWYGDQLALRALVGPLVTDADYVERHVDYFDLRVRLLPCSAWNYTPTEEPIDADGKIFLHFKGDRKDMMERYAA